jgi:hypothetical protein
MKRGRSKKGGGCGKQKQKGRAPSNPFVARIIIKT